MPTLILVHIGKQFPEYINTCIAQLQSVSNIQIHVLISNIHRAKICGNVSIFDLESYAISDKRSKFQELTRINPDILDGFWTSCMMRFFYIYEHIIRYNLKDTFHIENDNLIYADFLQKLTVFQTKEMWCVMDSPGRCIPCFLYFKSSGILEELLTICIQFAERGETDMQALAYFRNNNTSRVGLLPIVHNYVDTIDSIYSEYADSFECLFDGAAIGQYIGGVDPRLVPGDTRGFINETSVVKCNRLHVEWRHNKLFINSLPLINLHVHSKDLSRWAKIHDMKDNSNTQFDIVIPVGPNDASVIQQQLEYTKKNIVGYRNIYVVTTASLLSTLKSLSDCIVICEDIFPFTLDMMNKYANASESTRNGWYLQQLIKLYAGLYIPNILSRWLVIDSDTFFLKPTSFIKNGKCLYAYGSEYHTPYFIHMKQLIPWLNNFRPRVSGICHHMIFEKKYMDEIFTKVEGLHKKPFWQIFLECINTMHFSGAGASEYEIYFNYMLAYHPQSISLRNLSWHNTEILDLNAACNYISWHHYARK